MLACAMTATHSEHTMAVHCSAPTAHSPLDMRAMPLTTADTTVHSPRDHRTPTQDNVLEDPLDTERAPRSPTASEMDSSPRRKRLRWSTITVHEFGVGLGGSSISERGGPSIGLADKPEFTWTTKVGDMAENSEGIHRFTPEQRTRLLKEAGVSEGIISRYARETSIILKSRRRSIAEDMESSSSEEEETEDEDEELEAHSRKRKSESQHPIYMRHPQFAPMRRPRMIPANYV